MNKAIWIASAVLFASCAGNDQPAPTAAGGHTAHHASSPGNNDYAAKVNSGQLTEDTMKGSPRRTAMRSIHGTHIHIDYGSPGVKQRTIWGGLVAYDQIWATG